MKPQISVIMPIYNAEKTLRRALDSLIVQTYKDFEVIMVDDGSNDLSGDICEEYAARYPYFLATHQLNGGSSRARNKGIELARGKWITFCDADDYVYPCWLENFNLDGIANQYDLINQGLETDKPVYKDVSLEGKLTYGVDFKGSINEALDRLSENYILGYPVLKAYKLSFIKEHHIFFDSKFTLREDEVFLLDYAQYCKTAYCTSKIGYYYYVPQWAQKYNLSFDNEEALNKRLFESALMLGVNKTTFIFRRIREDLTSFYMREFNANPANRKACVKGLRYILKNDFKDSQLFLLTKLFVLLDYTTCLSTLVLRLHLRMKRL